MILTSLFLLFDEPVYNYVMILITTSPSVGHPSWQVPQSESEYLGLPYPMCLVAHQGLVLMDTPTCARVHSKCLIPSYQKGNTHRSPPSVLQFLSVTEQLPLVTIQGNLIIDSRMGDTTQPSS